MLVTFALFAALLAAPEALAQEHAPETGVEQEAHPVEAGHEEAGHEEAGHETEVHEEEHGFDILHHIMDAREIELPFGNVIHLPAEGSWMVGPVDMTPTKHVVFLWLGGLLLLLIFIPAAAAARRSSETGPKGHYNAVEALVLFFREQVVMRNIGHGGEKFAPFIITLFFFILILNLLGLVPYGASATGNVSVTAALALMSLLVVEVAGMLALGPKGYLATIVYIPKGLPKPLIPVMALIMTPVELLGKLTKPFALAIRLFANMTAGHVLLLAIISLIFLFGSYVVAIGPVVMAVALTFLELFVAFLQAYIFALLTSVFIGLIRHAH